MNTFGSIFRTHIFGESHGSIVGVVIDGCPAGMPLTVADFAIDMRRRKGGIQKGTTPRQETDIPMLQSGVYNDKTTGAPLTILFENKNTRSNAYEATIAIPRPSHADFVAQKKFGGYQDYRGGGHFSGRLTAGIVAAGVVAKKLIPTVRIVATILEIGGETNIDKGLQKAIDTKDSIGGIIDCTIEGLPVGLGEPFFDSVESIISHAIFSIPGVRGIEFGSGFSATKMFGTEHNDSIINSAGTTQTNHAGGVVGGITNGNTLQFRIAIKPTASTPKEQFSYNQQTNAIEKITVKGRHDLCIALRVPVIVEAMAAMVIADFMLLEQYTKRVNK